MNFRPSFSAHHWWGKFIGAFLGYIAFGPAGAILGILIGNLFDQGLTEQFTRSHRPYNAEKRSAVQKMFFEATFTVMGRIAKIDGRVTEAQINLVKHFMNDMRLNDSQRQLAQDYFRAGKQAHTDIWLILSKLRDQTHDNPELLKLFIDLQFQLALVGGLTPKKQQLLNAILNYMGFAPLHQQHRFYEDYARQNPHGKGSSGSYHHHQQTYSNNVQHAYNILGVSRNASKQEIKKAYRQLISRNHPDKLIAKGLPESMIKIANEKTQEIRKAYEQICKEKGW